ncbi:MAG: pitrilysin family protein [Candidatus Woykebacteria bacterium]
MKPEKVTLNNKLRVVNNQMPSVQSATSMILVRSGSRYEEKKTNGIAHFAEHMFFKGTKKRPSTLDISSLIDGVGGEFNAFTSKEFTGYYIKAAKEHLQLCLDVVSDMLLNSIFAQEEINRERNVIAEEIRMYLDTPMRYIGDIYEMLLFGDQPLGWDTAGTLESLKNIERRDFFKYIEDFYTPSNMVVVISGGVDPERANLFVDEYMGAIKDKKAKGFLPVTLSQSKPMVKTFFKGSEQAHLCLGVRSYERGHKDRYKIALLSTILGGSMSSRLFIQLRERRGLAYYVRAGVEEYHDAGSLAAQAGVEPKNIEEAAKVILQEYSDIAQNPPSEVELRRAKEYIKGKMILDLEDSREVGNIFGLQEILEGKIRSTEEIFKEVEKVTAKDIQSVAKDIFVNQGLNLAVIGPYKESSKFEKILRF